MKGVSKILSRSVCIFIKETENVSHFLSVPISSVFNKLIYIILPSVRPATCFRIRSFFFNMSYPIYNGVFKRSINVVFSVDLLISLDLVYRDIFGLDSIALIAFFSTDHQTGENKLLLDAEHLF